MIAYKFRALTNDRDIEKAISIINDDKIWCANWRTFNDPCEGHYLVEDRTDTPEGLRDMLQSKTQFKIAALCRVFDHRLMWVHYADEFKGIAIEVEVDDQFLTAVNYQRELLKLDFRNFGCSRDIDDAALKILATKIKDWEYEQEVRVIQRQDHVTVKVTRVILGMKMLPSIAALVRATCAARGISVDRIEIEDGRLQIAGA